VQLFNKRNKHNFFVISFAIILLLIFFRSIIFGREVFYCCDNWLINIPSRIFWADSIKNGVLPLWNPYSFSGSSNASDLNLGTFYPFNLLFVVLNPFSAMTFEALIHYFWFFTGMFFLLRINHISIISAVGGSIVATLSGTLIALAGNMSLLFPAAWTPWILYLWQKYLKVTDRMTFKLLVFASIFQVLAGHPQIVYMTQIVVIFYIISEILKKHKKSFRKYLHVQIIILTLLGFVIWPFFKTAISSSRMNQGFEYATQGSLNPIKAVRLIMPALAGNQLYAEDIFDSGSVYGYLGFFVLVSVLLTILKINNKFWLNLGIVAFLISLGRFSIFYKMAYFLIPGISSFRVPSHWLFIYTISISLVFAESIDILAVSGLNKHSLRIIKYAVRFIIFLIIIALMLFFFPQMIYEKIFNILLLYQNKIEFIGISGFRNIGWNMFINSIFAFVSCAITANIISFRILKKNTKILIIILVVFADLLIYVGRTIDVKPLPVVESWLKGSNIVTDYISLSDRLYYRFYTDRDLYPTNLEKIFGVSNQEDETVWQSLILRPNLNLPYQLSVLDGYSSIINSKYQKYLDDFSNDPTGVSIGAINNDIIEKLGLKYYLTTNEKAKIFESDDVGIQRISTQIALVTFNKARPIFEITDFYQRTSQPVIIKNSSDSISFRTRLEESGIFRVAYFDADGWNVYVDGSKTSIDSGEGNGFSFMIKAGQHQVDLKYFPKSYTIGILISMAGLFIFIYAVFKHK